MIHVSLGHCKQNKTYISIYITSQDQQLSVTLISDFLIIYLYFFTSEKINSLYVFRIQFQTNNHFFHT